MHAWGNAVRGLFFAGGDKHAEHQPATYMYWLLLLTTTSITHRLRDNVLSCSKKNQVGKKKTTLVKDWGIISFIL